MAEPVHVYPLNDLVEHELTFTCVCQPRVETTENGGIVIVHNSFDGRELTEDREIN